MFLNSTKVIFTRYKCYSSYKCKDTICPASNVGETCSRVQSTIIFLTQQDPANDDIHGSPPILYASRVRDDSKIHSHARTSREKIKLLFSPQQTNCLQRTMNYITMLAHYAVCCFYASSSTQCENAKRLRSSVTSLMHTATVSDTRTETAWTCREILSFAATARL